MSSHICPQCNKEFMQKGDLTRHQKKKTACIPMSQVIQLVQSNQVVKTSRDELRAIFSTCMNILRDQEGLTGDKALRNLTYLLTLKLIEPRIGNEINIDEYEYDFSELEDDVVDSTKAVLFRIVRFSNLIEEDKRNIVKQLSYLWDFILSQHPSTEPIFKRGKTFDITKTTTYTKLIQKLAEIHETDFDILGGAYEALIKDTMTGKVLGQFFTPPCIKKLLVQLVNPSLNASGEIDSCCDLTMGTAGLLSTYLNYALSKAKVSGIHSNWEQIKQAIYGKEIEPDTYQLAVTNMFISTGHMFTGLECGDSIRVPITRKFKNVVANMPFGIKGLKYDELEIANKQGYLPISSNSAVPLFLQAIIHILEIGGTAAVVLPDGQELFGKQSSSVAIREYLMKTCDLKSVIYFPAGVFEYTSIKTCVVYFKKKFEGCAVLTVIEKGKKRETQFIKAHATKKVGFYDYNTATETQTLLVDVPMDELADNYYSLNYSDYIKEEEEYGTDVKTLGEVCSIIKGTKKRSKDGKESGLYPLYYCSILGNLYLDTFDYTGEGIIINKTNGSGKAMVYYGNNKYNVGETTIHFKSKNETLTKYIYYYLFHNIELVQKYFKGANQKSIVEEDLFKIKIPIPSLERQREIVAYCESNDSRIQQLEAEIEHNKELTQQFMTIVNTKEPTNEVVAVRSFTSKK